MLATTSTIYLPTEEIYIAPLQGNYSFWILCDNYTKVVHTHVPLSPTSYSLTYSIQLDIVLGVNFYWPAIFWPPETSSRYMRTKSGKSIGESSDLKGSAALLTKTLDLKQKLHAQVKLLLNLIAISIWKSLKNHHMKNYSYFSLIPKTVYKNHLIA